MLINYIKANIRRIFRQKSASFINIFGLAIGFSISFIVLLYLKHETGYDEQHKNKDQIFRLIQNYHPEGSESNYTTLFREDFLNTIKDKYPEVIKSTGFYRMLSNQQIKGDENNLSYEDLLFIDKDALDIFTLPLIYGAKKNLLENPFDLILTESKAKVYFKETDPIGETLLLFTGSDTILLTVKGVIKDFPANSTFKADLLCLYSPTYSWKDYILMEEAYILLSQETDYKYLEKKFPVMRDDYGTIMITEYTLQAFNDIYFKSDFISNYSKAKGNYTNVVILSIIGIIILVVSVNNFLIFSIFDGQYILKDVAIRKIAGASVKNLRIQYYTNALLYSILGFLVAIIFVWLLIPYFNLLFVVNLFQIFSNSGLNIIGLLSISIITGVLSGSYLALYISSQNPLQLFRSSFVSVKAKNRIQKGIILFQIFLLISLSAFSILVNSQLNYALKKDPGFDKDGLLYINLSDSGLEENCNVIKQEIEKIPQVESITSIYKDIPCKYLTKIHFPKYGDPSDNVVLDVLFADENFFKTLKIPIINKDIEDYTLKKGSYVINKAAALKMNIDLNIENLLLTGKSDRNFNIAAVCENFDLQGIQNKTAPMAIILRDSQMSYLIVRTQNANAKNAIIKVLKEFSPKQTVVVTSFSEQFDTAYAKETRFFKTISLGNIIVIIITVLGIFNVTLLTLRKKTKEIIIRKALGAKGRTIYKIILKEFSYLILIANILAIPITIWGMKLWLQNFAYHVKINSFIFLFTACLSVLIVIAVSFASIKIVMRKNMIRVLNSE